MRVETWNAVDEYFDRVLLGSDAVLDDVLRANAEAGLPAIDVSANQGKLLYLLARMCGAKRILEIGTLGGYSTIWLARALPEDGRIVTLELEQRHADVACRNLEMAGFARLADVRVGPALMSLVKLQEERVEAFDLVFIDADKPNNRLYLEAALRLAKSGTVIVVDNVVREGAVADATSGDDRVQGSRRVLEVMGDDLRLEATALQTVGSKGHDGFAIARVR